MERAIIVGAGLAGITCALELMQFGVPVVLIDRLDRSRMGGLANRAFGGMTLVDTGLQRFYRIKDSPELAIADWEKFANFSVYDNHAHDWAKHYVERSVPEIYEWIKGFGLRFFPKILSPEKDGNSVSRYHLLWGTSRALVARLNEGLVEFEKIGLLEILSNNTVIDLEFSPAKVTVENNISRNSQTINGACVIVAAGGICGNRALLQETWPKRYAPAKDKVLLGADIVNDGLVNDLASKAGANVQGYDNNWIYPMSIRHPNPQFEHQGMRLLLPQEALFLNHQGQVLDLNNLYQRDTVRLCEYIVDKSDGTMWCVISQKNAARNIRASGADNNPNFRDRKLVGFIRDQIIGNKKIFNEIIQSEDIHFCETPDQLIAQMKRFEDSIEISPATLRDRVEFPAIAVRTSFMARKSMGGIVTNINSQILDGVGKPMEAAYAIGEAAGFGGGGINGRRSLEGTFLASCILTAKQAAKHISANKGT